MSRGTTRTSRKTVLGRAYSGFMRSVFQRILVPRFASQRRIHDGSEQWSKLSLELSSYSQSSARPRIWWHAASVGELEILWPVMVRLVQEEAAKPEFVITILSESACERLEKLVRTLEGFGVRLVFTGYSPWEGSWRESLEALSPDLFITSKYEAWPELWASLADLGIPLSIVSAKDRKSLRVCRAICRALGSQLPQMTLLTATREDAPALKESFPQAHVEMVGEPRWDQVWSRAQSGSARAKEIASSMSALPKPWGVLGSAWHEDVAIWKNVIPSLGTVLIVPHRVDSEYLKEIEDGLSSAGIKFLKTADYPSAENFREAIRNHSEVRCVVINEMGFLSELYSVADWAYVGGGIGRRGVHSTIEPAIHGIPISCGSYRAHQFVEISELISTGQLTIVQSEDDVRRWVDGLKEAGLHRDRWRAEARERLGATERIVQRIVKSF